jgi:hypothetical protein
MLVDQPSCCILENGKLLGLKQSVETFNHFTESNAFKGLVLENFLL